MRKEYISKNLRPETLNVIRVANSIISEYQAQGFNLTLRQIYYQFVSRGLIANTEREYKRLGSIINDGRLAGHIDWDAIEDRTRFVRSTQTWESPKQIIEACARSFQTDMWAGQKYRVEVWIEKDALIGVIEDVCNKYQIPHFSCRGYVSQSEVYRTGQRMLGYIHDGQKPIILHLGDHDPSGIDMTRDIIDRVNLFTGHTEAAKEFEEEWGYPIEEHITYTGYVADTGFEVEVKRLALNMDQVKLYNPPPNPAKLTDSRCGSYIQNYGRYSWELDALEPAMMVGLVEENINEHRDLTAWAEREKVQKKHIRKLKKIAKELK